MSHAVPRDAVWVFEEPSPVDERVRTESILRESETRHAFVLALDAALRPLDDPGEIQATASRILGQQLGVARVAYFDVRDGHYVVEHDYTHGVPSLAGRFSVGAFGARLADVVRRGHIAVNGDVAHDLRLSAAERAAFAAVQVAAYIIVPLMKNGRFVVGMAVHAVRPRAWTVEEIALVEETAERIWSTVLRARAERALAQSEERYRTLFAHIDEAFCIAELLYDENGRPCDRRLLEANSRYHALVGPQFSVGSTARMLLPNIDNFWFERCHEAISTGKSLRFEHHVPHLDSWYNVYLSRVGPAGSCTYAAVFHETTAQRRRAANLELLSEVSRDLVGLTDVPEAMRALGARICAHLHVDACAFAAADAPSGAMLIDYEWCGDGVAPMHGRHATAVLFDEELRATLQSGREVVRAGAQHAGAAAQSPLATRAFVCIPVAAEGAWRFALIVSCTRPRNWRDDEVDLLRELTERVWSRLELARADEALREQKEQLRRSSELLNTIVDRAPTGFYIVDADFRISHMNAESQARAFRNVNPAVGRRYDEAIRVVWPEQLASECIERFRHTLETGEPYECQGMISPRADVEIVECYDWQLQRIMMPDGRPAVVCYYYDTTRLRMVENELREADRRKDEFLAMLGHELRNPLAPIRNGLHYFRRQRRGGNETEAMFQMMERQFTHLVRLVDDLLEVSRITRGKVELRLEQVALADVLRAAVETSRPLIEDCGHVIEVAITGEALRLQADAVRLTQVFANLLNNAAKYTPRGGLLRLVASRHGGDARVCVSDNGVGIPAPMLGEIFELFTQVDGGGSRAQGGLGIGLTLVRSIVAMHGGRVDARSEGPGRGSEFIVTLPLSRDN